MYAAVALIVKIAESHALNADMPKMAAAASTVCRVRFIGLYRFLIFDRKDIPYSVYVVDRIVAGLVFVESSGVACVRRWKKCPVPGRRSGENARGINTGAAAVPQHRYKDVESG